jgi:hypothetical protein
VDKYAIVLDGDIYEVAEKDDEGDTFLVIAKFYDMETAKAYVETLTKK